MSDKGFIAALDQSGGSTPSALRLYGIKEGAWSSEDEMFAIVHQMRTRIITSPSFTGDRIIGAILFGHIPRDLGRTDDGALSINDRGYGERDRNVRAVLADVALLELVARDLSARELARQHDPKVLVEVAAEGGREVECGVLEGLGDEPPEASVVAEITVEGHEFYDFEAKYVDDTADLIIPADIPSETQKEIQDLAIAAFSTLVRRFPELRLVIVAISPRSGRAASPRRTRCSRGRSAWRRPWPSAS